MANHRRVSENDEGHLKVRMKRLVKNLLEVQVVVVFRWGASYPCGLVAFDVHPLDVIKSCVMECRHDSGQ